MKNPVFFSLGTMLSMDDGFSLRLSAHDGDYWLKIGALSLSMSPDQLAELHGTIGAALAGRALVSSPDATGCAMNPEVLPDPRSVTA